MEFLITNEANGVMALLTFSEGYATLVCGDLFQAYSHQDGLLTLNFFDSSKNHSVIEMHEY